MSLNDNIKISLAERLIQNHFYENCSTKEKESAVHHAMLIDGFTPACKYYFYSMITCDKTFKEWLDELK